MSATRRSDIRYLAGAMLLMALLLLGRPKPVPVADTVTTGAPAEARALATR